MAVLKYWDGTKYVVVAGGASSADEVTISNTQPVDPGNELWVNTLEDTPPNDWTGADNRYIQIIGDTMTGPLNLPAPNPTAATMAAHKGYVDERIWFGTQAQYDAISPKNPTVLYCIL